MNRRCLVLLLLLALDGGCRSEPAGRGLLSFVQGQRQRTYRRVPREVLAFYYTWYGLPERHGRVVHWGRLRPADHDLSESTHYPAIGAYDSHDPALCDRHIQQAKAAGLTGFIATWWGQGSFEDRALEVLLRRAEALDFKITVYWETAPGAGESQIARAVDDLTYVLRKYAGSPAFLRVDGRPAIFVYGRVMNQLPLDSWPAVIARTRAAGFDPALLADGYSEAFARVFDGIHTYNPCGDVAGKSPAQIRAWARASLPAAVSVARRAGRISCLTIIPGYDDRKIRTPGISAERHDGQTYRILWEEAVAADPDWILITSWNEWHEGSEIEPSWENADRDLGLTARYAPGFVAKPPVDRAPAAPGGMSPATRQAVQAAFGERTVAILPESAGPAALWLGDAGLRFAELTWDELLDPAVLARYPFLLYAGTERYTQSARAPGDVDAAIQGYLRGGGTLLCLPSMPFPFFLNERDQPIANARAFGLPIQGGWEQPPAGALTFRVDRRALPWLRASAAFPDTGDLRWRPLDPAGVPAGTTVHPLVELRDATGASLGLGAAYLELGGDLRGGRALYAWMRLADVFGDAFWPAVFRYAATRP